MIKRFRFPKRGLTLVEIVVASFLLSLLLAVAVKVMIPALRAWTEGQKRSEVSQGLLVTANWVGDDVQRSAPDSIKMNDEGVLVMRCALGQQADHTNEFDQMVAYWAEDGELYRASETLAPGGSGPPEITLTDLAALKSRRRVASDLEEFEVTVVQPWRIDLYMKLKRDERVGEIRTSFSSMYAPFDPKVVEEDLANSEGEET